MLGPREVAQPVLAEVAELRAVREVVSHQLLRGQRKQHLPAVRGGEDARHAVERLAEVIAIALLRRAGVQGHADFQFANRAPVRRAQHALGFQRAGERVRGGVKGHAESIAHRFENEAAARLKSLAQHPVVRGQRHAHRLGLQIPFFRAALDVAEQKSDGAGRRNAHGRGMCGSRAAGQRQNPPATFPAKTRRPSAPIHPP